ncbi:MAG: hypothetical protein HY738_18575, partial [Bacteroidia bacterium]|nr:hypothetical protein [Bacteroidia bacterium]
MKENDRLIDAIIDLGKGMKELRDEVKTLRSDMNRQLGDLNKRVESLEKQQAQTNLVIRELRLSYMKLAEKFDGLRSDVNSLRLELCKTNNKLDKLDADFNKYAASNDIIIKYH